MKLTIGEKIGLLRKKKNITQTELAEYLFLAPQTVSRWEVGNGAPEITLLPRIAGFFGVSIDELFGVTSLQRTKDLVAKYSVLRDDCSFQEAMDSIHSQLQSIEASLKSGGEDSAELEREQDQLEAEKMHMWIQQGREAFQRAFSIAEGFVEKTEENPNHPWYLPMRLQRDQLCRAVGIEREALAERKKEFAEHPSEISLLRYVSLLGHRQDYEEMLSISEAEGPAKEILFPPSKKNLDIWQELVRAAAGTGRKDFVQQHLPLVLEVCGKEEEFEFLLSVLDLLEGEKLAAVKQRLCVLMPEVSLNQYAAERIRERVETNL